MGDLGILEVLLPLVVLFVIPIGTLYWVAGQRSQGRRFALWGLLSYIGLLIGLLVMMVVPRRVDA